MKDKEEIIKLNRVKELIDKNINANKTILKSNISEIDDAMNFFYRESNQDSGNENMMDNRLKLAKSSSDLSLQSLEKLKKMKLKPYFGRVDFSNEWGNNSYYFGIATLSDEDNIEVHDWRTPVANLYYNGETGMSSYNAPLGVIQGEITLKRQYKFEEGNLLFYIDTTYNINDDMLISYLNTNDVLMRNIVTTIQKEQNTAIRYKDNEDLLVLGVAGSGKTSLALHRVAYLMYKDSIKYNSSRIALISPSEIFYKYIDDVLPSLGEKNIVDLNLNSVAYKLLKNELREYGLKIEKKEDYYERLMSNEKIEYLASKEISNALDEFIERKTLSFYNKHKDLYIGDLLIKGEELAFLYFDKFKTKYVSTRKSLIRDYIHSKIKQEKKIIRLNNKSKEVVDDYLNELISEPNYLELTKEFVRENNYHGNIIKNNKIEYQYVYTMLYIKISLKECKVFDNFNHLLIDEVQDLSYLEFRVINKLFKCNKTMLGDINQRLIPNNVFNKDIVLNTLILKNSYRSTSNIFNFLNKIINVPNVKVFDRSNKDPEIIRFNNHKEEREYLIDLLKNYKGNSLALIVKNDKEANRWYNILRGHIDLNIINNKSKRLQKGIIIGSIYNLKGLEFGDVIVLDVSEDNYYHEIDRNYLYIACSRAIHTLSVLYVNNISPFLLPERQSKQKSKK